MADDNSHVSKTIEDLRRQVAFKIDEARMALTGLNALETAFGLPLTQFGELANGSPIPGSQSGPSPATPQLFGAGSRRGGAVRPDEFLGNEPMQAAKKYIAMVGHAVTFDEIADGIQRGGAAVHGAGWRDKLETSLMRSPYEVIKVADKTYGLASFYTEEQLSRLRGARRLKRAGAPKPKHKRPVRATPKAAKKPEPKPKEKATDKQAAPAAKADVEPAEHVH